MSLNKGTEIILKTCLAAKPGERVLIVTDTAKMDIGQALFEKAIQLDLEAMMLVMKPTGVPGREPPEAVAEAMKKFDIVLCPTQDSLTHTQARKAACDNGARIATMPGITEDMFSKGALTADYREVALLSDRVTELLNQAETVRIEKEGKSLTMSIKGRQGISSRGLYHQPGSSGNLPTGEAYIAPVEGTAEGETIIDGSIANIGILKAPLLVHVEKGMAVSFKGPDAERLEKILGQNQKARNIGELGIGTNPIARLIGNILEDEKVFGTVHIAFGSNATFGGLTQAGIHIDGIILKPSLYLDEKLVVENGKILL
ncbi:MAG TPA: aminopeptidase [Spirochaetales bacterium]|nr:aminopeptidase [Spirochaetales bacterium]